MATYRNLPVYIGDQNGAGVDSTFGETGSALVATDVSIDFPTQASPKRLLGKAVDTSDQFLFGGPSEVELSFSFLLHADIPSESLGDLRSDEQSYRFLSDHQIGNGTGTNFYPVRVGDNLFGKCFLDSVSVDVRPFEPVTVRAKMTSYNPPRYYKILVDNSLPDSSLEDILDSNKLVYGHTVSVTNASQVLGNPYKVLSSISFNKTYSRTPVYKLGSINPSDFLVDAVDSEMKIESTGLDTLIDHSGSKLNSPINVALKILGDDQIGTSPGEFSLNMGEGSRVTAQNYTVQGGETLLTNATIKEVIV